MSKFLINKYNHLKTYVPGEQPQNAEYIKLNTNESPFPPALGVIEAINSQQISDLRLYSDPECLNLRKALAKTYNVDVENVYVSNGSDDILNFAFMAFCGDEMPAAFPAVSYGFYKVFAELNKVKYKQIPLMKDFSINIEDYFLNNGMVVIANPNAPTGLYLDNADIEKIVNNNPDNIVLIDEAYIDFGGKSVIPLIKKYPNLLVVQTFSKSRSLAGGRLGFAIANKAIIDDLNKIKYSTNPYNVNRLTLIAGQASLANEDYYRENCKKIMDTREYTSEQLKKLGFNVLKSKANFLFAESNLIDGEKLYAELKNRGILVRHFNDDIIKNYNRISIGTFDQMNRFIKVIQEILEVY